jgi:hypothetical protein
MSNIFKCEKTPQKKNILPSFKYNHNKNNNNDKNVKNFDINEKDFPVLHLEQDKKQDKQQENTVLEYKNAILIKEDKIISEKKLAPGWLGIRMDENRNIVFEKYDYDYDSNHNKKSELEEFHDTAYDAFQALLDNWENEKIKYNKLHGEGEYERIYSMPNIYNEYEEEEDEEEEKNGEDDRETEFNSYLINEEYDDY